MTTGVRIDALDGVPRPIIALGSRYPDGHAIAPHRHRRGQLISGVSGVVVLATPQGTWSCPHSAACGSRRGRSTTSA